MAFKINSVEFILSAAQPKQFLSQEVPEVAFAGRSNVGKSSLLNVLVQRKSMAKTSKTPGKTRLVNFFDVRVDRYHLRLVDLPGYGFTKAKPGKREEWGKLIEAYITGRPNLRLVCSLIDCRHEPAELDIHLLDWLHQEGVPFLVVLTKADKLSRSQLARSEKMIRSSAGLPETIPVVPFSSPKRLGRDQLWREILNTL